MLTKALTEATKALTEATKAATEALATKAHEVANDQERVLGLVLAHALVLLAATEVIVDVRGDATIATDDVSCGC